MELTFSGLLLFLSSILSAVTGFVFQSEEVRGQGLPKSATTLRERFDQLDQDRNGILNAEEFLKATGEGNKLTSEQLRQRFLVFDQDRDEALSYDEYITIPGIAAPQDRGPLPDPVTVSSRQIVNQLSSSLKVPASATELATVWGEMPESIPRNGSFWDLNRDGQIDSEEVRTGLEMAYGLLRPDGKPARQPDGRVFNGSYIQHLDRNGDQSLSRDELLQGYHLGREAVLELLTQVDRDNDQRLTLEEIDQAGLFQTDLPGEFLKWDRDFNGQISAQELELGAAWQRHLAPRMLPAFDEDHNGALSLTEYQRSPLSNPLTNWTSLRRDRNGNGTLELAEFATAKELCGSGLSERYFRQLDRNQDGHLDLQEFNFTVDPGKLSATQLAALYDRNADRQIDLLELFTRPGRALPPSTTGLLIPHHAEFYRDADRDRNGTLSIQELMSAPELLLIAETEDRLRGEILPGFEQLDQNQDRQLDQKEWARFSGAATESGRTQAFRLADMDQSGTVSLIEYCAAPTVQDVTLRPWVPDPVWDEQRRIQSALERGWPPEPGLSASDLSQRIAREIPGFNEGELSGWDLNRDGAFDRFEVQSGLLAYFALTLPSGQRLHRPNGQVFNLRTVQDADLDKDQSLSREEFFTCYWKQGAEAEEDYRAADFNTDGRLSLSELLGSHLFWIDTQQEFLRFDDDLDGRISREELLEHSRQHEKRMAQLAFPGFDTNQDGVLSFTEFRNTPLANPVRDYDARRWDLDHDGQLSLQEFHRDRTGRRWGIGLSEMFFRRLDHDQDQLLCFAEMKSSSDLKRLPVDALYERLDSNRDGSLQLSELLSREQPRNQSTWAKRNSEQRMMEVEEAFLAADQDRSHSLSREEFQSGTSSIRDVVLGVTIRPPRAEKQSTADSSRGSSWRTAIFIVANLCLFLGIGFWQLRRSRQ